MKTYQTRKRREASERGVRMATLRWSRYRALQEQIAAMDPARFAGKVRRRIIVIENECRVRETVIYDFDSSRRARAKERAALAPFDTLSPVAAKKTGESPAS